jgi:hypothetical protein
MSLSVRDGGLIGTWSSQGSEMELTDLKLEGNKLSFKRAIPGGPGLEYEGTVQGDRISGKYTGGFGELESNGQRKGSPESGEVAGSGDGRTGSADSAPQDGGKPYRGLLGPKSKKVRRENGKTFVWASGDLDSPSSKWYDFTGSPIPAAELQFGIGQDRIPSIDDPLFVAPDDPRLLKLPPSPYRRDERPRSNDEIMVIGYANGDDVRAYPAALLDRHELVNDTVGGKPVTVGW